MSIKVKCFPKGPLQENTYIITDAATGLKAVIDPGYYGRDAAAEIGDASSLRYILLTHGHYDHFAAAGDYIANYPDAVFAAPEAEARLLSGGHDNMMMARRRGDGRCPKADLYVKEGDEITVGETVFRVIATPGHTEGGICYASGEDIFTGDTLFRLSVGNTGFETGDWETMVCSIQNKLYTLDEDMKAWPGHGDPTTIGFEKRANPFV